MSVLRPLTRRARGTCLRARRGGGAAPRLAGPASRAAAARCRSARRRQGERSSRVLSKPGSLDESELAEIRAHPVEGAWLIAGVRSFAPALPYVLFHHERWDGGGYPTRRAGREIPIEGRILAVADAFDAMTSSRPYRDAPSSVETALEVERCAGTQFDREVAELFVDAFAAGEIATEQLVAVAV